MATRQNVQPVACLQHHGPARNRRCRAPHRAQIDVPEQRPSPPRTQRRSAPRASLVSGERRSTPLVCSAISASSGVRWQTQRVTVRGQSGSLVTGRQWSRASLCHQHAGRPGRSAQRSPRGPPVDRLVSHRCVRASSGSVSAHSSPSGRRQTVPQLSQCAFSGTPRSGSASSMVQLIKPPVEAAAPTRHLPAVRRWRPWSRCGPSSTGGRRPAR